MDVGFLQTGWGWSADQMRSCWIELEQLGYDICYVGDDFFPHPQLDENVFDPWTTLPAMAATTARMKIGSLVSPTGRRHPGLFAKMTTGVDQYSNGRLIVGLGAGNAKEQQDSLHQEFLPAKDRVQLLREELTVLRSLWTESRTTFHGEHISVTDAICEPKGVRRPHPEVLIALKNKTLMSPIAGEFADRANLLGADDDVLKGLIESIRSAAVECGRDDQAIVMGRLFQVLITPDAIQPDDVDRMLTEHAAHLGVDPDEVLMYHHHVASYVGPIQGVAEAVAARTANVGVDEVVLGIDTVGLVHYERTMDGLRALAADVVPELQAL